jgi:hypothetical protein
LKGQEAFHHLLHFCSMMLYYPVQSSAQ